MMSWLEADPHCPRRLRPEHVSVESCTMRTYRQPLGLSAFARPRRAEQDQPHRRRPRQLDRLIRPSYCAPEVALDLRHGIHRNADHDQQRGAAE